jgi:hypothetical protein
MFFDEIMGNLQKTKKNQPGKYSEIPPKAGTIKALGERSWNLCISLYPVKNYDKPINESDAKKRCKQKFMKAMQKRLLILIKDRRITLLTWLIPACRPAQGNGYLGLP